MTLNADGTYVYTEVADIRTGGWYATDNLTNNMFRSVQTKWNGTDEYLENLFYYEFTDNNNTLTLSWPTVADYILVEPPQPQ